MKAELDDTVLSLYDPCFMCDHTRADHDGSYTDCRFVDEEGNGCNCLEFVEANE